MHIEDVVIEGQSLQSATVENVQAQDVLQAEMIAERAVNRHAASQGLVNSTERWEKITQEGDVYTIKFF